MMRASDMTDFYGDGAYLRRWTLVDGYPRCVEDAYALPHPDEATQLAANAALREQVALVEDYEAALAIRRPRRARSRNPRLECVVCGGDDRHGQTATSAASLTSSSA